MVEVQELTGGGGGGGIEKKESLLHILASLLTSWKPLYHHRLLR